MPDDFAINVKQIVQYPLKTTVAETDLVLLQESASGPGAAGAYRSTTVLDLVSTALMQGGFIHLAPDSGIAWNGAALMFSGGVFSFTEQVSAPNFFVGTFPVATQNFVLEKIDELADSVSERVTSFNFRTGDVQLEEADVLRAGAATVHSPHFDGQPTVPTPWNVNQRDKIIANTEFVQRAICFRLEEMLELDPPVFLRKTQDVNNAFLNSDPGVFPRSLNPPLGDASNRIATTLFVDESLADLEMRIDLSWAAADQKIQDQLANYALLNSPQFTGQPTAPTANPGNATGQLATTSFVMNAVAASTAGVATWNGRTGLVTMVANDITLAGGALLASPHFTGLPTAPTPAVNTNTNQVATCDWVMAELAAGAGGVSSFNARTGAVVLTLGDVTDTNVLSNTHLMGVPTAPTAVAGTSTTQLATTAFVQAALAAAPGGVSSFNTRTGAITLQGSDVSAAGGALTLSPTFSGTPAAPTAAPGTNTTQIATTAFVAASYAPLASPALTGTPGAPTAPPGTSTTQIATTAFVQAAITSGTAGVSSFNTRVGAVTLTLADVTATNVLNNTPLTGVPTAPTAAPGTNTTEVATTAFVMAAVAAFTGGVSSFNSRTGAVTLQGSDVSAAGGALVASPTFTGVPAGPTATAGTNTTQLATTAFVMAAIAAAGGVTTFNGRSGAVLLTSADVTAVNGALTTSPTFTGTPAGPTAAPNTNTTQFATTAFVTAAIAAAGVVGIGKQTIWVPAAAMTPTLTMGAAPVQNELPNNKIQIRGLSFDPNNTWIAQFEIAMPKSWNMGTVTFQPVWSSSVAAGGNVIWGLQAVAISNTGALDVPFGTAVNVQQANAGANQRNIGVESAAVTIAGTVSPPTVVIFQIFRDAPNAFDTFTGNATLHGVNVFYTTNAANDA